MRRNQLPLYNRALRDLRRWLNTALDGMRTPLRKPTILLVGGKANQDKVLTVEERVRFLLAHIGRDLKLAHAQTATPLAYLRNTAVVAVDGEVIPAPIRRHLRWVADLDYESNPIDGWALIDLGVALRGSQRRAAKQAHSSFVRHVENLNLDGPRPVYIFGTGPSLQLAHERSFDDGVTVVCNTTVRDADLWNHLSPAFLAAGDAIYHFGDNPHSAAFRADALRRLRESDGRTLFVYPAQFDVIVRTEFSDVAPLLAPIPFGPHTDVTVDLTKHFYLPLVENVLANLLLPIGCTVSNDIRLWGFDGRAPADQGFWANSDRHSYPELMQSIRDAHPAFFAEKIPAGNETRYVNQVHGDVLDQRLTAAELRGYSFTMLHPSWTPILQKRFRRMDAVPNDQSDAGPISAC